MRILIVGAGGLIGKALVRRLKTERHFVGRVGRPGSGAEVILDLEDLPSVADLNQCLRGWDLLINAAGVGPGADEVSQYSVHYNGPCALFNAAVNAGISRIVQISAQGSAVDCAFLASKHAADAHLLNLPGRHCVVRPSLVFAPDGISTRLFQVLAGLPIVFLPATGQMKIQPIHIDDLVETIMRIVSRPECCGIVEAGGPRVLSLADYLKCMRYQGYESKNSLHVVDLPPYVAHFAARILQFFNPTLLGCDALRVLMGGSVCKANDLIATADLRDPQNFATASVHEQHRKRLRLSVALGLGRLSLALVCFASALVPLFWPQFSQPYERLARLGLSGAAAQLAFYSMVVMDCVCGVLALTAKGRWFWGLFAMIISVYTFVLSVFMPELWGDAFGPLLKNLPMLAWVGALALLIDLEKSHE